MGPVERRRGILRIVSESYKEARMRPGEIVLSVANLLTFFSLAVPLPLALRWMRYAAPIALGVAIVHVAAEGPRWAELINDFVAQITKLGPSPLNNNPKYEG